MQERPSKTELLDAITEFLLSEVHPKIEDKGLAFRVLIAANLTSIVRNEIGAEFGRDRGELERLRTLLHTDPAAGPGGETLDGEATRSELIAQNRALAERLRAGAFSGPEFARAQVSHQAFPRRGARGDESAI
ncbi:MAG: DUF6285 domain-containing protein [Polyangiales bacterium]